MPSYDRHTQFISAVFAVRLRYPERIGYPFEMDRSEKNLNQGPRGGSDDAWPRRLDFVAASAAGLSRRQAQKLIAQGVVLLNGRATVAGDKGRMIGPEDRVEIRTGVGQIVPQPEAALAELASGPGWVAVDKPAGVPVHPLREGETGTLMNAVAARYHQVQGVGASGGEGGLRSGVVHRLDTDTSGVILIALEEERWAQFRAGFAEHRAAKVYTAVVKGEVPDESGFADVWLTVKQHRPAVVQVVERGATGARRCTLAWRVVGRRSGATVLEIDLHTGFLHQIRATFAHLGHPVLGDRVYHPQGLKADAPRLMLHATHLKLNDIDVSSRVPSEFTN